MIARGSTCRCQGKTNYKTHQNKNKQSSVFVGAWKRVSSKHVPNMTSWLLQIASMKSLLNGTRNGLAGPGKKTIPESHVIQNFPRSRGHPTGCWDLIIRYASTVENQRKSAFYLSRLLSWVPDGVRGQPGKFYLPNERPSRSDHVTLPI